MADSLIIIRSENIVRETQKAVLVKMTSTTQLNFEGKTERQELELWLPKSKINKDYIESGTIHCPNWVYESAVEFSRENNNGQK